MTTEDDVRVARIGHRGIARPRLTRLRTARGLAASAPARRARAWWSRHRGAVVRSLPLVVLVVGMVVNAAVLLAHSDDIWFWADDWDLLFMRGAVPEFAHNLLEPHNNHWLTAHILVYRVLFDLFGIVSYTPFAATAIGFHLLVVALVRVVLHRAGAGPWVATGTALTVAFFGLGANAQIPSASLNHVGALACGFAAAYVVARAERFGLRELLWVWLALVAALMFGLTSLALVVLVVGFTLLQHRLRAAVLVVSVPSGVFLAWWLTFGRYTGVNSISPEFDLFGNLPGVPAFMWTGITGTLGDGSGLSGAGPLLAGLILLALIAPYPPSAGAPSTLVNLAWAGVVAEVFQLLVVSVARYNYGADQIGNSHYSYINLVLLSPAIALVATRLVQWTPLPRVALAGIVTVAFVAYALNGVVSIREWQRSFQYITANSDELALGIKAALEDGQEPLEMTNPDGFNKGLSPLYIGAPRVMAALGSREATPEGRLAAETTFFTVVDDEDHGLAGPPVDLTSMRMQPLEDKAGCQQTKVLGTTPELRLTTGATGNEIVVWSNSTRVAIHLERGDASGAQRDFEVEPGAVHIATTATDAELYVAFDGTGTFTVCRG